MCGENRPRVSAENPIDGSSPRVRGKQCIKCYQSHIHRLIPACAGKTCPSEITLLRNRAHPRVCGENRNHVLTAGIETGSSPRVRGKLRLLRPCPAWDGLIPACAGKTFTVRGHIVVNAAHPRVCGENRNDCGLAGLAVGSSPRVRGKLTAGSNASCHFGLIPACAGKTRGRARIVVELPAHPRVCGENRTMRATAENFKGSSPRVRGKQIGCAPALTTIRLIPACAGKTES